jgi:TonB family protein
VRLLPALILLLLPACSAAVSGPDRPALLLSDRAAPRDDCRIVYQPHPLPPVGQIADSAALVEAVSAFTRRFPLTDGPARALYSVAFDRQGRLERLHPIDFWLPQRQAEAFHALVRTQIRTQASGPWSVRLLVEDGAEPTLRVGYSERCDPVSRTHFRLIAPAMLQLQKPQPVRVRLDVTAEGRMRSVDLVGSSGSADLDRWITQTLQRYEFTPGLLDGAPVPMAFEETIRIQARP